MTSWEKGKQIFSLWAFARSTLLLPCLDAVRQKSGWFKKKITCTELEDQMGCPSKHSPIVNPDKGSFWCWITIRSHLCEKGLNVFKHHVSSHTTNLPFWNLQGSTKHGKLKGGKSFMNKKWTWISNAFFFNGKISFRLCRASNNGSGHPSWLWALVYV